MNRHPLHRCGTSISFWTDLLPIPELHAWVLSFLDKKSLLCLSATCTHNRQLLNAATLGILRLATVELAWIREPYKSEFVQRLVSRVITPIHAMRQSYRIPENNSVVWRALVPTSALSIGSGDAFKLVQRFYGETPLGLKYERQAIGSVATIAAMTDNAVLYRELLLACSLIVTGKDYLMRIHSDLRLRAKLVHATKCAWLVRMHSAPEFVHELYMGDLEVLKICSGTIAAMCQCVGECTCDFWTALKVYRGE